MKKISVIIPVYNTKEYLYKCLSSVSEQSYTNLEVICIDDGSTDGSGEIVDEFAKKDKRFVVRHQKNGGESRARNAGLKLVTGDYVTFVDCDDWLENDMYQKLVTALEQHDVDMVACGYFKNNDPVINDSPVSTDIINRQELLNYVYHRDAYRGFTGYIWCKLYKRSILYDKTDGKGILFPEDIILGGDIIFFAKVALNTKNAYYLNVPLYHYIIRKDSSYHSEDEEKWKYMILTYKMLLDILTKANISEDILVLVKRFLVYRGEVVAQLAYKNKNINILKMAQETMRQYEKEYLSTNQEYPERLKLYHEILSYKL